MGSGGKEIYMVEVSSRLVLAVVLPAASYACVRIFAALAAQPFGEPVDHNDLT